MNDRTKRGSRFFPGALVWSALLAVSCGEVVPSPTPLVFSTPQALAVDCTEIPEDLAAQLWVSGSQEPCELDVDLAAGNTSGSCTVTTGRARVITVDWFVVRDDVRVLLAQARQEIDFEGALEDVELSLGEDDLEVTDCLDVTQDSFEGSATQLLLGEDRPVCDLDESCGGDLQVDCSNLGEICAGGDPLSED